MHSLEEHLGMKGNPQYYSSCKRYTLVYMFYMIFQREADTSH